MQTLAMLKLFDEVYSSQTKLCRVKQGREAHEVISTNDMFSKMICHPFYNFTENACLLHTYVLSFVDSKAQLRYFESPNAAVPPWLVL